MCLKKKEPYLLIKLLSTSRSYMPEMKLKQQNMLYNFNSTIKSLETKLGIFEKLTSCQSKPSPKLTKSTQHDLEIKHDIIKV